MSTTSLGSRGTTRVLLFVFVVLSVITLLQIREVRTDLDKSQEKNVALSDKQEEAAVAAKQLSDQVEALGAKPVVDTDNLKSIQGLPGINGRPPTFAEISAAVQAYCSTGRCDGRSPSVTQVAQAVASFCNARGQCKGSKGDAGEAGTNGTNGVDGTNGADGKDGSPGAQGPGPSDDQIQSAVETYCTNAPCAKGDKGDKGDTGETGATGPPGPLCPDGFTGEAVEVVTETNEPLGPPTKRTIFACVPS